MHGQPHDEGRKKGDRALVLYEQGVKPAQIAERLGIQPNNVSGLLRNARKRRESLAQLEKLSV
jgi:DNA-binding CsgD family transcriptional regulator